MTAKTFNAFFCLFHVAMSKFLSFFSTSAGLGCEELPMQIFNVCTAKSRSLDTRPGWVSLVALDSTFKPFFPHKIGE